MATYTIKKDSVKMIGSAKVGLVVTFTDEVNGKPPVTHYHEVESTDQDVIEATLSWAAQEYEERPAEGPPLPDLTTDTPITVKPLAGFGPLEMALFRRVAREG
jgi:hypothetical protein